MSDPTPLPDLEKDHQHDYLPGTCEKCKAKVILHCDECKVPVTACMCGLRKTATDEVGEDGLRKLEDASRRDRLRQQGLSVPDAN